jgi:RNA polymerase sigma-70 factor, ECF subfamily
VDLDSQFELDLVALVPRLRRFAYALTGSADEGDDLVQAACERALRSAGSFRTGTRMDSWMFRIVQNLWLDSRRRASRAVSVDLELVQLSDDGLAARRAEDRMTLTRVRERVATLPPEQRAVLALVAIEGLSYGETAEILGVPIGTVMSRLSRARARLLPAVQDKDG